MFYGNYGKTSRLKVTGLTCLSSCNAQILHVIVGNSATGALTIYHGVTASVTVAHIRGYGTTGATVQASLNFPCPAYCSGGITVDVADTLDNNITLFWNPLAEG